MITTTSNISKITHQLPYLKMLILFGSRAKGNTHANSDWDFAVLYDKELYEKILQTAKGWEFLKIYSVLEDCLKIPTENMDVVELDRCPPLLAHNIACYGKLLYEQEKGLFEQFKQQSVMTEQELKAQRKMLYSNLESFLQELGV